MNGLLNIGSDPLVGLGVGLLAGGQPGGSLAGGLSQGLQGMQNIQQSNQANQMNMLKLKMLQDQQEQAARQQQNFQGLLSSADPQTRQLLGVLGPEAGAQLLAEQLKPVSPYSTMGKLQADLQAGRITPEQYKVAMQSMAPSGMSIEVGPDGQVRVVQGPGVSGQMTSSTKTGTQKDVINALDTLNRLDAIKNEYSRDYLTYGGNAKYWALDKASKAGAKLDPANKQFLQGATKFRNQVEQFFNQYRKEITGAAASVQELDRLKESMLNKDMSPDAFEAAYQTFRDSAKKQLAFKQKLLREGVPLKEIYNRIDRGEWKTEPGISEQPQETVGGFKVLGIE